MPSAFRRAGRSDTKRERASPSQEGPSSATDATGVVVAAAAAAPRRRSFSNNNNNNNNTTPRRGVKPWQGGSYRTSVGLNDLDAILGGGQVLGTTIVLEEDRLWTRDLAHTLVKYWCAEALSQDQQLLAPIVQYSNPPSTTNDDDNDNDIDPLLSFVLGANKDEDGFVGDGDHLSNQSRREELCHLLGSLPRNLHWDKQKKREENQIKREEQQQQQQAASEAHGLGSLSLGPTAILEEEDDEGDEEYDDNEGEETKDADDGLQVAWQYKTSVQQQRLAKAKSNASSSLSSSSSFATDVFCHSYDLSGRMNDQTPLDPSKHIASMSLAGAASSSSSSSNGGSNRNNGHHARGYRLFSELVRLLTESMEACHHQKAVRLLLYRPPIELLAVALPLLVAHIRNQSLPVVVLVCTTPPAPSLSSSSSGCGKDDGGAGGASLWLRSKLAVSRASDVVLSTEGFAARYTYPPPAEFRHLQGVLKLSKVATTTRKRTDLPASIYGFKRDRRKLHVPLLHIPPEDYFAEGGGSVSGGVRSGAGRPSSSSSSGSTTNASGVGGGGNRRRAKPSGGGMGCSSNQSGSLLDF